MNVESRFLGPHPFTGDFLACVTTDEPDEFKAYLAHSFPTHLIVADYKRSPVAVREEGGYPHRLNIKFTDPKESMLFKLSWSK
jgi:hypothetical protein